MVGVPRNHAQRNTRPAPFRHWLFYSLPLPIGMSGVRGRVLALEENCYLIREISGKARLNYIDEQSKRDKSKLGGEILVFLTRYWHAAYNKNLES